MHHRHIVRAADVSGARHWGSGEPRVSAADSGGSGSGGGADLTDACSLLTQAEVSGAMGLQVSPGTAENGGRSCSWQYIPPGGSVLTAQASIDIEGDTFDHLCDVHPTRRSGSR